MEIREFWKFYFFLSQGKIGKHSQAMVGNFNAGKGKKKDIKTRVPI